MKKFAFIIHPRLIDDFGRRVGSLLGIGDKLGTKILPKKLSEHLLKHLRGRAGFTICSRFNIWDKAEGYIIAVLLTAKQMMELPRDLVEKRIIDAVSVYLKSRFYKMEVKMKKKKILKIILAGAIHKDNKILIINKHDNKIFF